MLRRRLTRGIIYIYTYPYLHSVENVARRLFRSCKNMRFTTQWEINSLLSIFNYILLSNDNVKVGILCGSYTLSLAQLPTPNITHLTAIRRHFCGMFKIFSFFPTFSLLIQNFHLFFRVFFILWNRSCTSTIIIHILLYPHNYIGTRYRTI